MSRSGSKKISLGKSFINFFALKKEDAEKFLDLEEGEMLQGGTFGRWVKNFIIAPDTNLYVTNKRIALLRGNELTNIWFSDIKKVELLPSTFWESVWNFGKYDSLFIDYETEEGIKTLRYWCSNGEIGAAPTPNNEMTKNIYSYITEFKTKNLN